MLITLHNQFRVEKGLEPFIESEILNHYAVIDAKWAARRKFVAYWNFEKRQKELLANGFEYITYNIATGDSIDIVMKHVLNDRVRSDKLYGNYKWFGSGCFKTNYTYWILIYGR